MAFSRHCWAFSDLGYVTLGLQAGSIAGDKLEIASCRFGSSMQLIFAPIDSLRWIVKPSQVELTADGLLPMTPAPFTRLVDALGGVAPVAIDQSVLG